MSIERQDPQGILADLFRELAAYSPTLVGTYPLGLQVASSDLDVVCSCADLAKFEQQLVRLLDQFGKTPFQTARVHTVQEASVTHFHWGGFAVEVFAQGLPIYQQAGFRHMVIEGRLLALGGEPLREVVIQHKHNGLKTEPAFARALGLEEGEPYAALLALETWSSERLKRLIAGASERGKAAPEVRIFTGARTALRALFEQADDSPNEIASYIDNGTVLVLARGEEIVGQLLLVQGDTRHVMELKSLAVVPALRGQGLGQRLVEAAIRNAREFHAKTLLVATASADPGVLRFYQRSGFRMLRIERDAFTVEKGYPEGLTADGVPVRDRVWLELSL